LTGYSYNDPQDTASDTFWDGTGVDSGFAGPGTDDVMYLCADSKPGDPREVGIETSLGPDRSYCSGP
jgi:hypothetical protein